MKVTKRENMNIILKNRLKDYVGRPMMVYGTAEENTGKISGFTTFYNDYDALQRQLLGVVDISYMNVTARECEIFYQIGTTSYQAKIGVVIKEGLYGSGSESEFGNSLVII